MGDNGSYFAYSGSNLEGGSTDFNWHIASILYNVSNTEIRIDGSQIVTGSAGTNSHTDLTFGYLADQDRFWANVDIAEALWYSADKSTKASEVESYLNEKWGIFPSERSLQDTLVASSVGRKTIYTQSPAAQYVSSENTTFIVYRGSSADPYAISYDHSTDSFTSPVQIGTSPISDSDSHGPPTLTVGGDGTIHVFYGSHNTPQQYAQSDNPYDISSLTNNSLTSVPDMTYPSPVELDGTLYVSGRSGTSHGDGSSYPDHQYALILESTDGGNSWTDLGPVLDFTDTPDETADAYLTDMDEHNGELHCSFLYTRGTSHADILENIHHARYDPANHEWTDMAGNTYPAPIQVSDLSNISLTIFDDGSPNLGLW